MQDAAPERNPRLAGVGLDSQLHRADRRDLALGQPQVWRLWRQVHVLPEVDPSHAGSIRLRARQVTCDMNAA